MKTATVFSTDPERAETVVNLSIEVIDYINVSPFVTMFEGTNQAAVTKTAIINTDIKEPMTLKVMSYNVPDKFKYELVPAKDGLPAQIIFTSIPGSTEMLLYPGLEGPTGRPSSNQ